MASKSKNRKASKKTRRPAGMAIAATLAAGLSAAVASQEVVLVEEGKPLAVLVLPAAPAADEDLAARELQDHLEQMSGARLEIVHGAAPPGQRGIFLGATLAPEAAAWLQTQSQDPAAFGLWVGPERIALVGNSPEGTLFAAYELLEQLGCRWYFPGELGRVIPRQRTVALPSGQTFQAPSFPHRHLQNVSESPHPWARRQRLGGLYFPGGHGIPLWPEADFEREPELFALVDGKRQKPQLCVSNPEVRRRAAAAALKYFDQHPTAEMIGMGPEDGAGFCTCENCRRLDSGEIDPITGQPLLTDRYVWLFNRILEIVHARHPGKKIAFYAYTALLLPPRRESLSPFLVPALAPIDLDRIHGMSNPLSPDRSFYRTIMSAWCRLASEVYERGYYFNLACPGLPFSKVQAVRDEIPVAHQLGIKGWRVESMPSWASTGLTLYVAARLMWDVDTDVDALLAEFYERFFGSAAEPMGKYLSSVDRWFRDTECFAGSSYCLPRVFTPARMARCQEWLDFAAALAAGDPTLAERVRIFRLNHDRLAAFLEMLAARDRFDFAAALAALDRLKALTEEMVAYRLYPAAGEVDRFEARLVYPHVAAYIDRFWAPCIEEGYARVVAHGELVAETPDVWDFLIDPTRAGQALGWFRDGRIGGNWQRLRTRSATWSDQGLHYYKGLAWYRAEVEIPARFQGRPIFLWFGGVDEKAKVWLNGKWLGESDGTAFAPFEFEVAEIVRCGAPNFLAVEVTNLQADEVGTGGITAPAMFWSPRSDEDLERIRRAEP